MCLQPEFKKSDGKSWAFRSIFKSGMPFFVIPGHKITASIEDPMSSIYKKRMFLNGYSIFIKV